MHRWPRPASRYLSALRLCLATLYACLAALCAAHAQGLPPGVAQALERAQVPREAVAVLVVPARSGTLDETRARHRADQPMNPASLMKLVTTYAALDILGPAYTWPTEVWLDGTVRDTPAGGTLEGDLVIRGSGDPKLVVERLWLMLRRVQALGVREIAGDIVLDRSAFAVPEVDPGAFDDEPLRPYNVQPDALLLNYRSLLLTFQALPGSDVARIHAEPPLAGVEIPATVPLGGPGCADWRAALRADFSDPARVRFLGRYPRHCEERIWPVAPPDPAGYNARALLGMWAHLGGRLKGRVRDGLAPAREPTFVLRSPPLAEIARDVNKFSNNVMAQHLLLTMGRRDGQPATLASGRLAVDAWQQQRFGRIDPSLVLDNGAGLSRDSRATADFLARLLQSAYASAVMPEFIASLPISGLDGTLRRATVATGQAHLKTGSLRDVQAIAGYVRGESGRRWVVVAIVNHPQPAAARPALQALVEWVLQDAGR